MYGYKFRQVDTHFSKEKTERIAKDSRQTCKVNMPGLTETCDDSRYITKGVITTMSNLKMHH